ncbi:ATP-binding protein [Pseudooceanicola algae]|uniref:histidine kinase n=1 Tax=Pseudooceanicola algae TaxID=1537215 RepID=A0A418SEJ1_9RHOB|nr:ATP-binding protein [Pseudooceanicola algae]QPM89725.1 Sensor histidine kinase RcsC [Pseudooceanicola algae]
MAKPIFRSTSLDTGVIRIAILGTITALCVIVIVYLVTDVRQKLRDLNSSPTDSIQWTLSQLEVEYLELQGAVALARLQPFTGSEADVRAALTKVRDRYDILYSRFGTLAQAPLYTQVLLGLKTPTGFISLRDDIYAYTTLIDDTDAGLLAGLPGLQATLDSHRLEIRRLLSNANLIFVGLSDKARLDAAHVLRVLAGTTAVLLLALSAMVILFRSLARVSKRRLEQKLVASARLETIFSTSRDAILVFNQRGQLIEANRAAREMFRFTREEAPTLTASHLLRRQGKEGSIGVSGKELFATCGDGPRTGYRLQGRSWDGHSFPVELSMAVNSAEERPILVCVIRDVSHLVTSEAELKASRDKALAGERAKARFLGVISHEMRTPLNGILGTIDLMEENSDPAENETYVNVVRSSAQTLLDLVNDVLDITQIEGSDVIINPAPFDLDRLIEDILASEMPRARRLRNTLTRSDQAAAGWVLGDATRVRQILLNIVSNAVKFTEDGAVTITVERLAGDRVCVAVRDTGIGMTAEDCERIFLDFVRLDGATSRQIQGTGLGLGIAQRLANAMEGGIEVDSDPGRGTEFRLILPLPAVEAVQACRNDSAETLPEIGSLDILLVEDNITNRFVARRMLERDGHRVTEAENGKLGLEASCSQRYDIILMDVSMPVMDGIEATRAIRAGIGLSRKTRIIALTAHVGEEVTERLRGAGLDDVIAKPIRAQVLRRLLVEAAREKVTSGGRARNRHR